MTDERMSPDVRLREGEAKEIAREATYALANCSRLPDWMQVPALGRNMRPLGDLVAERLTPVVERIVAARVEDGAWLRRSLEHLLTARTPDDKIRVGTLRALLRTTAPVTTPEPCEAVSAPVEAADDTPGGKRATIVPGAVSPTEPNRNPR